MDSKLILLSALLLTGCSTKQPPIYVPVVPARPVIQLEPEPDLAVLHLTEKSTASEVAVAYVDSLIAQENYILYLKDTIGTMYDSSIHR